MSLYVRVVPESHPTDPAVPTWRVVVGRRVDGLIYTRELPVELDSEEEAIAVGVVLERILTPHFERETARREAADERRRQRWAARR